MPKKTIKFKNRFSLEAWVEDFNWLKRARAKHMKGINIFVEWPKQSIKVKYPKELNPKAKRYLKKLGVIE